MDLEVVLKLIKIFALAWLIIWTVEHSSKTWGKEFIKHCCVCEVQDDRG